MRTLAWVLGLAQWSCVALALVFVFPLTGALPGLTPIWVLVGLLFFLAGNLQLRDLAIREIFGSRILFTGLFQGLFAVVTTETALSLWKHAKRPVDSIDRSMAPFWRLGNLGNSGLHRIAMDPLDCIAVAVGLLLLGCHFRLHANLARDFQRRRPEETAWQVFHLTFGVVAGWAVIRVTYPGTKLQLPELPPPFASLLEPLGRSQFLFPILVVVAIVLALFLSNPRSARWMCGVLRQNTIGMLHLGACVFVGLLEVMDWFQRQSHGVVNWLVLGAILLTVGRLRRSRADQVDAPPPSGGEATLDIKSAIAGRDRLVVVAAEGGGIHAAVRALFLLSELNQRSDGRFWDKLLLVSSVSGGSVGTAAFCALGRAMAGQVDRIRCACHQVARFDLLTIALGRLFFTEPFNLIKPDTRFDRSRGLDLALVEAVRLAERRTDHKWVEGDTDWVKQDQTEAYLSQTVLRHDGGPIPCYNTTSITYGDRLVLTPLKLARARTLGNQRVESASAQDVQEVAAACLSARFPGITGPGIVQLSEGGIDHVMDGGLVDNTGLKTAMDVIRAVRQESPDLPILLIAIGNAVSEAGGVKANPCESGRDEANPSEALALASAASQVLLSQNREGSRGVPEFCQHQKVELVHFPHLFAPFQIPLGWFMARSRVDAIAWIMGLDTVWTRPKYQFFTWYPRLSKEVKCASLDEMFPGADIPDRAQLEAIRASNQQARDKVIEFVTR